MINAPFSDFKEWMLEIKFIDPYLDKQRRSSQDIFLLSDPAIYIKQKCLCVRQIWRGDSGTGGESGQEGRGGGGGGQWGGGISQMDMMECLGGHRLSIYIYQTEMSLRLFVCHLWSGDGGGGGKGGQEGGGQW